MEGGWGDMNPQCHGHIRGANQLNYNTLGNWNIFKFEV